MILSDPLANYFRLTPRQTVTLVRLGIATVRDLLFYFPARYEEFVGEKTIAELKAGERATVECEVEEIGVQKTWKRKISIAEAVVKDGSGFLRATWFNQPYIAKMLKQGDRVRLSGKVGNGKRGIYFANPAYELSIQKKSALPYQEESETLLPVYPESYGISSRWLRARIKKVFEVVSLVEESLPESILSRYHLPKIRQALRAVHFPKTKGEAEAARKRFAFEEIFIIQLARRRDRKARETAPAFSFKPGPELINEFAKSLPYELTGAQKRALNDILGDLEKLHPMTRLLQGDVGSGKTVVAAAAALAAVKAGLQVAFMAPTEILARQHFEELRRRFGSFRVPIGFLTSSGSEKFPSKINPQHSARISKNQLLRWVASGEIKVLVGTHSLIEERVKFKKLGLAVVDEQHRFGTKQRHRALKKSLAGATPHYLSMSATPIPRTLALTLYGDLDVSVIDEMPPGRQPVQTKIVLPHGREGVYNFIRSELENGSQAFVICPRIEERNAANYKSRWQSHRGSSIKSGPPRYQSEARYGAQQAASYQQRLDWSDVKSVKKEHKKLSGEIFPEFKIGMVHGRLTPKEKETMMREFRDGKLQMLVSTSVVEVGVDIPNASIMLIEGGERFGLATLHQFRGRVGRRGQKAFCFVFTTNGEAATLRRLKALESSKSGFELAEYDLQFRGPGELAGSKQWGVSDVGMEALKNMKMVEAARKEAEQIVAEDPDFKNHPSLKERVDKIGALHFE